MEAHFKSVSAIWGDEHKSIIECAERVYAFLLLLKSLDQNLFGKWHEQAYDKKKAIEKKIELSPDDIQRLVRKNWDKRFPDLGCTLFLWTGHEIDEQAAQISFILGSNANQPGLNNNCVVNLPQEGGQMEYYQEKENQEALIKLMKEFWRPNEILVNGKTMP